MKAHLPEPNAQLLEHSDKLKLLIQQRIGKSFLNFEEFMRMCLYSEELGYYESALDIFGADGDFITSPEISPYFAQAFSHHIKAMHKQLGEFFIIEIGAGSGRFAVDLLKALQQRDCQPINYYIVETSKSLQKRQQEYISKHLNDQTSSINWVDSLQSQPLECGVVIANEVLDALPVRLISIHGREIYERCVEFDDSRQQFAFVEKPAHALLKKIVRERLPDLLFTDNDIEYKSEINIQIDDFVRDIATFVNKGIFFYIDYGYPRPEYYHEQRNMGTLICHFQHMAHDDPLRWPGIQDITASVDFTAVAEAALKAGLSVDCYTTQAHFLMASHVLTATQPNIQDAKQLKKLLLPGEMGERFQTIILSKNMDLGAYELTMRDLRHRL